MNAFNHLEAKNCPVFRIATLKPGSVLLLQPGHSHAVRNTGTTRLYCLTTMVPDEDFAKLITSGVPDELDEQDLAALGRA